jgi:hypothetical protein
LTSPDPQLNGAWYSSGFNPCACQVKTRFQSLRFKFFNLHRYVTAVDGFLLTAASNEAGDDDDDDEDGDDAMDEDVQIE